MSEQGQGRLVSIDLRDREHIIPNKRRAAHGITQRFWYCPDPLDQGNTSACVGFSGYQYLWSAPVLNRPRQWTPHQLYKLAQEYDEWPGNNYDGSSVRGLFKALHKERYVTSYKWAFDCETVVNHILTTGPVVVGTAWTLDMANPTKSGYIVPSGNNVGGHAWLIIGANRNKYNYDKTKGALRMVNSWGVEWGDRGRAWITFQHFEFLLKHDGEACTATEILRAV